MYWLAQRCESIALFQLACVIIGLLVLFFSGCSVADGLLLMGDQALTAVCAQPICSIAYFSHKVQCIY